MGGREGGRERGETIIYIWTQEARWGLGLCPVVHTPPFVHPGLTQHPKPGTSYLLAERLGRG